MSCNNCGIIPATFVTYLYDFLNLTHKIMRVPSGVIFSISDNMCRVRMVVNDNKHLSLEEEMEFSVTEKSLFDKLISHNDTIVCEDLNPNSDNLVTLPFGHASIKSLIAAPLVNPDRSLFGFLCFFDDKPRKFNRSSCGLFEKLKDSIEKTLEQIKDKKKLDIHRKMARFFADNEKNLIYKISYTPEARFEYINSAIEKITGYTPKEFYDDPGCIFRIVFPEDRNILADLILNKRFKETIVSRWIRKDGSIILVELHNYPEYDEEGNLTAFEGIAYDITDKSNWEVRIRHLTTVLHGLREINRKINSIKNRKKLFEDVCCILSENKSYSFTSVAELDSSHTTVTAIYGEKSEEHSRLLESHNNSVPSCFRWVLKHPGVLIIDNPAQNCECQFKELYGDRNIMLSPIEYDKRCYGVIKVALEKDILIDIEERGLLKEIAENIAYALRALELEEAKKEAERKAAENEERYKRTLDSLMEGCVIIDKKRNILYMNEAAALQLDLDKSDYIGTRFEPGRNRKKSPLHTIIREAMETGKQQFFEYPLEKISGEKKWFDVRINPVPEGLFIMFLDISHRKRIEESLIANEKKYKMIADFTYDWETYRDQNGEIAFLSPSFERITGYRCSDYVSGKVDLTTIVHQEDMDRVQDIVSRSLNKEVFNDEQFRIIRSDRQVAYVSYSSQPVIGEDGNYLGFRSSIRDITRRKNEENQP